MVASSLLLCFVPSLKNAAFTTKNNARQPSKPKSQSTITTSGTTSTSLASSTSTVDLLPEIREAITEADGIQEWTESVQLLSDLFDSSDDDSEEQAELYLADAFRWKAWANASDMMKKYQRPVLPDATKLGSALEWLKEGPLEMSPEQVRSNIRDYPGIYLVDPIGSYKKVLGSAPRKYRDADVLKEFIGDDPNILQVTFNCGDEGCQSECGSCWVAYENRLPSIPEF